MNKNTLKKLKYFYEKQLFQVILPFWSSRSFDYKKGGFYTCFENSGKRLVSKDKYSWAQGRFIWLISALVQHYNYYSNLIVQAEMGVNFLLKNAFLDNGNCIFLLNENGMPKESVLGQGFDISIFADCFLVLGFARYALISRNKKILEITWKIYNSINDRIKRGNFGTAPEPCIQNHKFHGVSMIMLNISEELAYVLKEFKDNRSELVKKKAHDYMEDILNNFVSKDNYLFELISASSQPNERVFSKYINPGHTLEDMWLVIHQAISEKNQTIISRAIDIIENTLTIGWDKKYGGLFHFVDKEGGKPKLRISDNENHFLRNKIREDWDYKLWWVHSEALYASLLGYHLSGNKNLLSFFNKLHKYTFSVFPNQNPVIGEWIQIRDRKGNPVNKIIALPVKDPFHIIRDLILILELLKTMIKLRK